MWVMVDGSGGVGENLVMERGVRWGIEPGLLQGCHHGTRAPTCPESWPSAAGSHALSSEFPDQGAGMGEGAEKAVGPPLAPLLPVLSWD